MGSGSRPMKVGLFVPHFEDPWNGRGPRWRDILDLAKRAEAVGFDSFWMPDHLFYHFEGVYLQGGWDAWSLLAALAAATERMEIAPLVACAGYRNPALIAKMADTIDEISGGRFILGIGAGWHKPEFDAFGFPYDHRVSRFEEAIQIIRGLLKDGHVDFEGRFYQARDCELIPRGPRPNGPPLMIGSIGARMLRLTAAHADSWNVWYADFGNRPEGLGPVLAKFDAACAEVGRDPATLERTAAVLVALTGETGRQSGDRLERNHGPLRGSPEEMAEALRAYARAGIAHVQLVLDPITEASIAEFGAVLAVL